MFKLDLEKIEEPEIKFPTSNVLQKRQENSRKTYASALLTTPKSLTMWITAHSGKFSRDGNTRPPNLPPEKSVCRTRSNSQDWTWSNRLVLNWERSTSGCILLPHLFNFYAECIIQNARLDEAQAGIKITRRSINNHRYADDTTLMAESEEELKSLLIK